MPVLYLNTGASAGDEISSTYEGRHVTIEESLITHPTHADGFVDGGDPIVLSGTGVNGHIVGVALSSAAAATDLIAIDTEGIFFLSVVGSDDAGNSAVDEGDIIYINTTTCVLSKIANWATQIPFGLSLGDVPTGTTAVCAVKVHWAPAIFNENYNYNTVTSGAYSWQVRSTLAGGATEGLCGYVEGHLSALQTGNIYGFGSWINVDAQDLMSNNLLTPFEGGVWAGTTQTAGRVIFAGQHQAILTSAPATSLHAWRLNSTQTITALIAAANPGTIGYSAGTAGTGVVGTVPLFDAVGPGILYIDVHAAVA